MELTQHDTREAYLQLSEEVDYAHPAIKQAVGRLFAGKTSELERVVAAFEYVRDEIDHSWDIQSRRITRTASEVLHHEEGICYAKANLLAALLRSAGIPAGFCYQRLTIGDTPESGFCLHALNAVYLRDYECWIRLDARGNKPGVDAQFSVGSEQLAFAVREELGEKDYPVIWAKPHPGTMAALRNATDCLSMYQHGLPQDL